MSVSARLGESFGLPAADVDFSRFLSAGEYVVCAKSDDPILRPARARLIWAANTAAATAAFGISTTLVGSADGLTFKVESLPGTWAVRRRLRELYSVNPDFNIMLVRPEKKSTKDRSEHSIPSDYVQQVFPRAGIVHTRDPAVALACAKRRINYVLEHHSEDYQTAFTAWRDLGMQHIFCRAIVAITERVRETLLSIGVPPEKIIVLDSGVNLEGRSRRDGAAEAWRRQLQGDSYHHLIVYTGGMQAERGIGDLLDVAARLPRALFVLCGGHPADISLWTHIVDRDRLNNVRLFGYLPQDVIIELQQAADAVVLTRAATDRSSITSPLKFFEYLLSGTPIVSAKIDAMQRFMSEDLAIDWYRPGDPVALAEALARSFCRFTGRDKPHVANVEMGLRHSWEERQRTLMRFVGHINVKTTF